MSRVKVQDRTEWVLQQCRGKKVLDVGCASIYPDSIKGGNWLHGKIAKCAKSAVGIDNNLQLVRLAQKCGYAVYYANAECFNLRQRFEVVFGGESIEHFSNPGLFLECARRHLLKNGKLVLTTPNARHPGRWIRDDTMSPYHLQLYTMQVFKQLLRANGFGKIKEYYFEGGPKSLMGKLYVKLFLPLFPKFSVGLGVVAEDIT